MNFAMIDEVLELYIRLEKKYVNDILARSLLNKQQDKDISYDIFDEMCLIVDKVAKRVSTFESNNLILGIEYYEFASCFRYSELSD